MREEKDSPFVEKVLFLPGYQVVLGDGLPYSDFPPWLVYVFLGAQKSWNTTQYFKDFNRTPLGLASGKRLDIEYEKLKYGKTKEKIQEEISTQLKSDLGMDALGEADQKKAENFLLLTLLPQTGILKAGHMLLDTLVAFEHPIKSLEKNTRIIVTPFTKEKQEIAFEIVTEYKHLSKLENLDIALSEKPLFIQNKVTFHYVPAEDKIVISNAELTDNIHENMENIPQQEQEFFKGFKQELDLWREATIIPCDAEKKELLSDLGKEIKTIQEISNPEKARDFFILSSFYYRLTFILNLKKEEIIRYQDIFPINDNKKTLEHYGWDLGQLEPKHQSIINTLLIKINKGQYDFEDMKKEEKYIHIMITAGDGIVQSKQEISLIEAIYEIQKKAKIPSEEKEGYDPTLNSEINAVIDTVLNAHSREQLIGSLYQVFSVGGERTYQLFQKNKTEPLEPTDIEKLKNLYAFRIACEYKIPEKTAHLLLQELMKDASFIHEKEQDLSRAGKVIEAFIQLHKKARKKEKTKLFKDEDIPDLGPIDSIEKAADGLNDWIYRATQFKEKSDRHGLLSRFHTSSAAHAVDKQALFKTLLKTYEKQFGDHSALLKLQKSDPKNIALLKQEKNGDIHVLAKSTEMKEKIIIAVQDWFDKTEYATWLSPDLQPESMTLLKIEPAHDNQKKVLMAYQGITYQVTLNRQLSPNPSALFTYQIRAVNTPHQIPSRDIKDACMRLLSQLVTYPLPEEVVAICTSHIPPSAAIPVGALSRPEAPQEPVPSKPKPM